MRRSAPSFLQEHVNPAMNTLIDYLSSLKLTLGLLLGLSLVCVFGTFSPVEDNRYDLFFQHPGFRLVLTALFVNLLACTVKTVRRNLNDRSRSFDLLQGEQIFAQPLRAVLPARLPTTEVAARLATAGYRTTATGATLLGWRGQAGRWGSTLVHAAFLVVMLGALAGEFGFVGTLNIAVGDTSSVYYDWDKKEDRPLGFEFRVERFDQLYYPIELRFAAVDRATRQAIETYTVKEGESVTLPGGLTARVIRFFPFEEDLLLALHDGPRPLGEYHALGGKRTWSNPVDLGYDLKPVAFRDPVIKQYRSEVAILEGGEVVKRGVIEINQPLTHRGVTIYQTAANRDKFGMWSTGFQFSRDPGEPVVWFGCILLILGMAGAFFVPYRAVGVGEHGGERLLVALAGFRGDTGAAQFAALQEQLTKEA